MRLCLVILPVLVFSVARTSALKCLFCDWSHSFDECDAEGQVQQCLLNQKSCESIARRDGDKSLFKKGCKDYVACRSSELQNLGKSGNSTQCNSDQQNSVCTCCCDTDVCNVGMLECTDHYQSSNIKENDCPPVSFVIPFGKAECNNDNKRGSVCEYKCTDKDYSVWPQGFETNVCLSNGSWGHEPPCCARPCPPYYLGDLVIILHFTGKEANKLLRTSLEEAATFGVIGEDALKISLMYYSGEPVESSIIRFNEYGSNATRLLELGFERMSIQNEGPVNTGKAIRYAMANLLTPESGIRDDRVQKDIDVYLNTNPDDDVKAAADEAGRNGIVLGGKRLDRRRLLEIAGDEERVFVFNNYMTELSEQDYLDADKVFCSNPCEHVLPDRS